MGRGLAPRARADPETGQVGTFEESRAHERRFRKDSHISGGSEAENRRLRAPVQRVLD